MWQRHKYWLIAAGLAAHGLVLMDALVAPLKSWRELDWFDIIGEGGAAVLLLLWFFIVLSGRPAGKVTHYFAAGLLAVFMGLLQDALDEILQMTGSVFWHNELESLTLPVGLLLITLGLFHWHREQQVINTQLQKREQLFRSSDHVDAVTQVAALPYLQQHLTIAVKKLQHENQAFALVLLDIDQFHQINEQFGPAQGDAVLHTLAEFLMLNLRQQDLLCRYAGDRYGILLPATRLTEARQIAAELVTAVDHFALRSRSGERIILRVSAGVAGAREESPEALLDRATIALLTAKQSQNKMQVAA